MLRLGELHRTAVLIWTPIVANLLLAVWAGAGMARKQRVLPETFWAAMLAVLVLAALQVLAGVLVFGAGARPRTGLHVLYGVLVLLGSVTQYGLRPGGFIRRLVGPQRSALNEPRVMTLVCLTQAALMLRAWMTAAR